jgi:serine/threonine protein kinase
LRLQTLLRELLDAVAHMHAHGIVHRDLKLENLVFGKSGDISTVTIVDFGLAKAALARERLEGVTGTLWYTAPEVLKGVPYSPVVDLWSIGVVGYLVLTGALLPLHIMQHIRCLISSVLKLSLTCCVEASPLSYLEFCALSLCSLESDVVRFR